MAGFAVSKELYTCLDRARDRLSRSCPWGSQIQKGEFADALQQIEGELANAPSDPALRLWWTQCQLQLNRLPTAAVCAPLDEMVSQIQAAPQLSDLAAATFVRAAAGIAEKNQPRLAVSVLERGIEFAGATDMFRGQDLYETKCLYRDLLNEEIKRAPLRKESKAYVEALQKKLDRVEHELAQGAPAAAEPAPANWTRNGNGKRLNSKSILAEVSEQTAASAEPQRSRSYGAALALILVLPLLAYGAYILQDKIFPAAGGTAEASQLALNLPVPDARQMELPPAFQTDASGQETLDSVGKRLAQLALNTGKRAPAKPGSAEEEVDKNALDPQHGKNLPRPAKTEDDEIVSLDNIPEAENAIKEKVLPKVDGGQYAGTPIESIGGSYRRAPIPSDALGNDLSVGPDGRVYGPPKGTNSAPPQPARRSLDGGPLKAYEVQQFNPPLLYRTITSTNVLSAPSLLATTLKELDPNTPIHVTARMGRWLELRANNGKVGYIFEQDANPASQ